MNITEEKLTSFSRFTVTSADTDMYSRLRLGAAVNFLIQSAIDSADSLGFGYLGLRQQNLFWVLSRLNFELYRPLMWHEKIEVETWPKTVEKVLYIRDYLIRDENSEIVGKATSGWLAVDLLTKKLKKIDGTHAESFIYLKNKYAIIESPEKLAPFQGGESNLISTGYYDIDLNGHVTTTRYIDWMMDMLPLEFHRDNYPSKLSLNMMKEILPEETVRLTRGENGAFCRLFEGYIVSRSLVSFRATLSF